MPLIACPCRPCLSRHRARRPGPRGTGWRGALGTLPNVTRPKLKTSSSLKSQQIFSPVICSPPVQSFNSQVLVGARFRLALNQPPPPQEHGRHERDCEHKWIGAVCRGRVAAGLLRGPLPVGFPAGWCVARSLGERAWRGADPGPGHCGGAPSPGGRAAQARGRVELGLAMTVVDFHVHFLLLAAVARIPGGSELSSVGIGPR
jgi:hypothetical protein